MRILKRAFRDIGSLIRGGAREDARASLHDMRVSSLRERFAVGNGGSRPATADDLAAGIAANELFLEYQPKLDWRLGRITSAEALVRWQHPSYGVLPPDQFIGLAAQPALMRRLTDWVIAAAATQVAQWRADGLALEVSVNISPSDVEDVDLPDRVERHCRNVALDPALLTLELPEPGATCSAAQMTSILTRLRLHGVKLSIDDFGGCYGPLVQLQKAPFSEVKIDLAFVKQMMDDTDCRAIVETLIDLARDLDLKSVAEGVEDDQVLKTLIELGCDSLQGHYICRPIAAGQIPPFIRDFEGHSGDDGRLSDPPNPALATHSGRDAPDDVAPPAPPKAPHQDAAD